LIAGSRIEISENKKNSEDFVLWKPSTDDEPYWDSLGEKEDLVGI